MTDAVGSSATGLVPRAVRLRLDARQVPLLRSELLARLDTHTTQARQTHERDGRLSAQAATELSQTLLEYRELLDALDDDLQPPVPRGAVATASMSTADDLVRACAGQAAHHLRAIIDHRSGDRDILRDAGAAASAWARTLADLRDLDESAPDTILD